MSLFCDVVEAAPVEIFVLEAAFRADNHPNKVNLGIGAYRTEEGKPWVLPVVRDVEIEIANDFTLDHEYYGQCGDSLFAQEAVKMLIGPENTALKENRVIGIQSLSGTGALRIGGEFLKESCGITTVYHSSPSWPNHPKLFKSVGFTDVRTYRYWNANERNLNIDGMLEDLRNAPPKSVIVLHACAHNPTGIDPTPEQWKLIANVMEEKKLFPFFDCAYQGFASGDLEKDSYSVRYFISRGFELFCAQSFSKNFGLYNERVGNLTIVTNDNKALNNIKSQFSLLIRAMYSNPPAHGSRIVKRVLSDPVLFTKWKGHINFIATRIREMRQSLRSKLEELKTPGSWNHITDQIGMFSYLGINEEQVKYLVEKYHIYLPKSGRISICGLNHKNVEYVAKAINDAVGALKS